MNLGDYINIRLVAAFECCLKYSFVFGKDFVHSLGSLQEQTSVLPDSSEGQHTTTAGKVLLMQ